MYCAQCGATLLDEGASFCEDCGAKVEFAPSAPGETVPDPAPALPPRALAPPDRFEAWRAIWLIGLVLTVLALLLPWLEGTQLRDVQNRVEISGYTFFLVALLMLPAKIFSLFLTLTVSGAIWSLWESLWLLPWAILILFDAPFMVHPLQSRGRPAFAFLAALAAVGLYLFRWRMDEVLKQWNAWGWVWGPGFWVAMAGTMLIGVGALVRLFENARENIAAPSGSPPCSKLG